MVFKENWVEFIATIKRLHFETKLLMNFVGEVSFLNNNATLANIAEFPFFKNAKNFVIAPNGFALPSISPITSKLVGL